MDKLQWFKFTPSDWMMGKIQRCPEITQARFMRLCCLYWNKECLLSFEDAEIEIDKEHLDILISKKIIKSEDDFIKIEFLDEQMDGIIETSEKRRAAVLKRWNKVKQKDTSVLQDDTSVLQNDTDKSREEEKRQEGENKILHPLEKLEQKKDEDLQEWFLDWFNKHRTRLLEIPSNFKKLQSNDIYNLTKLNNTYNEQDFEKALKSICMDKWACENDLVIPKHFLNEDNFVKYLNATPKTHMSREQKKRKGWTV